jgi:phage host-nuclease inhibitor protein Gam
MPYPRKRCVGVTRDGRRCRQKSPGVKINHNGLCWLHVKQRGPFVYTKKDKVKAVVVEVESMRGGIDGVEVETGEEIRPEFDQIEDNYGERSFP